MRDLLIEADEMTESFFGFGMDKEDPQMKNHVAIAHALDVATAAHVNQLDKQGKPYIDHPVSVAAKLQHPIEKQIALLHDVVEDTHVTLDYLAKHFHPDVVDGVRAMTHLPHEDYFDYVKRVSQHPLARNVKLADVEHNLDDTRGPVSPKLKERYTKAMAILRGVK